MNVKGLLTTVCLALNVHKRANLRIIPQKSKPKATFSANLRFSEASVGRFSPRAPVSEPAGMRCRTEVLLVRGYASGCKNRNATARYVPLLHFGNTREAPRHADGNRSLRPFTAVGPPLQRQWTGAGPLTTPFRFSLRRRTVRILTGAFRPPPRIRHMSATTLSSANMSSRTQNPDRYRRRAPPPRRGDPHARNGSRSLASFLVLQMPHPSQDPAAEKLSPVVRHFPRPYGPPTRERHPYRPRVHRSGRQSPRRLATAGPAARFTG